MKRFLIFLVVLCGCNTDFFESEGIGESSWHPNVAVPIGYAEFTLEELLNEADSLVEIREDENNFITLIYEQQLLSESADEFLGLISQQFSQTYNITIPEPLPDPVVLPNVSFTTRESLSFEYDPGENLLIDSIHFDTGNLTIDVTSTIKAEVDADIIFPNLLVNGEPLVIPLNLDNFGGAYVTEQVTENLSNFVLDMSNNIVNLDFLLDITTYGAPVSSSDQITIDINLDDLSFKSFFGNVGTRNLKLEDERFTYDIFDEINFGEIFFDDPRLIFTVENSFGLPVSINLSGVYAEDPQEGRIDLAGDIVDNPPVINAPDFSQIGETVTSVISIDKSNSNFNSLVSALPTALNLPLDATTNPNGETENFVLDSSRISILLTAELPLDLRIANLKNDVIFDFQSGEIDYVEQAKLRIHILNGFPLEGKISVIFRNEESDNLLTITPNNNFDNPLFEGAPVDQNGIVTEPLATTTDFLLNSEELELIQQANEVKVEVEVNTTSANSNRTVKILSSYKIKISLGIETGLEVGI